MFNPNKTGFCEDNFFCVWGGSFQEELIENISLMLDNISSLS